MTDEPQKICTYRNPRDGTECTRGRRPESAFCPFHSERAPIETKLTIEEIDGEIKVDGGDFGLVDLLNSKDGNWKGFVFPEYIEFKNLQIDFELDASDAKFGSVSFTKCEFNILRLESCEFKGRVRFNGCKHKEKFLGNSIRAKGQFSLDHSFYSDDATFGNSHFEGEFSCAAHFESQGNFGNCVFWDRAQFLGWTNISISVGSATLPTKTPSLRERFLTWVGPIHAHQFENVTNYRVFADRADLQNLSFRKPNLVSFTRVNFSRATFQGTDLRGVSLVDVIWGEDSRGRHIIYDDVYMMKATDKSYMQRAIRVIEETYRKLRIALEENREYTVANDFYFREMRYRYLGAHKIWREFTVNAIYGRLSGYGVRPGRAFGVLVVLIGLHAVGTAAVGGVLTTSLDLPQIPETAWGILDSLFRSLRIVAFQRVANEGPMVQNFLDIFLRIFGIVQIALFSFALRSQIRR